MSLSVASRLLTPLTLGALSFAPLHATLAQAGPPYRQGGAVVAATCESCAEWSVPHAPLRLHGNSWYVGTRELTSVLITSPAGHILIDPGLAATVPQLLDNVRTLGFDPRDIKVILTSHVHYDHAGGAAALQKATGARVMALPWSAGVLTRGIVPRDDPQAGVIFDIDAVPNVRTIAAGDTVRVGTLALIAVATPGHTPGSTSWRWQSCDGASCVDAVYADSQTPISADGFLFTVQKGLADAAEAGHKTLETIPCRLLITPHPAASRLWERVAQGTAAGPDSLLDSTACARYAQRARAAYAARYAKERAVKP
jgi:metallo-beta-lactamase class B